MDFFMNGNVIAVSAVVRRCKPSLIERRRPWSAARGWTLPSSRQRQKHSDQGSQCGALPAGSRLRSTPIALPSFSAPRCCHDAVQSASHKAGITMQRSRSAFGPMRHNLAVVRDAPPAAFVQPSHRAWQSVPFIVITAARPTPPRWASQATMRVESPHVEG